MPEDLDLDPRWTTGSRPAVVIRHKGEAGPYDVDDPDAPDIESALDFGSLRIPLPARAQLQVEKGSSELLRAVHVLVPSGRVSLSALAAPRSSPLWRELAKEISDSLSNDGARVRSEWGEWGREVQAGSNGALSRFIGVDGSRWMLYGVATGPADSAAELASTLRQMIRETVVTRGPDPLPVKTVLPLRLPEHLEERVEESREHSAHRADSDGDPRTPAERDAAVAEDRTAPWPEPDVAEPETGDQFGQSLVSRSIGLRRSDLRPVTPKAPPRAPVGPGHPTGHGPMPPVPSIGGMHSEMDTDGFPRVPADPTWTMAIPVVSSAEVEHQPAWADLSAAPSFWPEPYLPAEPSLNPLSDTVPGAVHRAVPANLSPGRPLDPPPPARASVPPPVDRGQRAPVPVEPYQGLPSTEPDPAWPAVDSELIPADPLHDALTSDVAVTQDRLPRVERRAKHRRPD
ncbi:MAG TPA: DUF3710 domain-containing protein [Pseudonocardia sp.]|jgi:hypothetical protein